MLVLHKSRILINKRLFSKEEIPLLRSVLPIDHGQI